MEILRRAQGYSGPMPARREDAEVTRTHRALANVNRVRLMRLLQDGPREVAPLSAATGLHPNTVRAHLDVLVGGGLVERRKRPTRGPGRPAWAYGLAPPPAHSPPPDQQLTMVLADALRRVADDPAVAAERAGRPWGRQAAAGERAPTDDHAIERVVDLLAEQGFAPELRSEGPGQAQVLLRRCPYDDLAQRYGDVVCSVHLGLIRGALEELGASVEADLRPMVEPGLCITQIRPAPVREEAARG
jgi:predicted ArsR family transcriptional regulator